MTGVASALHLDQVLHLEQEVCVGLVGPHQLVERIVLAGLPGQRGTPEPAGPALPRMAVDDGLRYRLRMAAYRSEHEAAEKVARLGDSVDVCLFASQAPLEYARRAGVLACPAVAIQLDDGSLLATLLAARRAGADLSRPSFDTLARADVDRALAELGLGAGGAQIRDDLAGPAALASYHARLWQVGLATVVFTCLDEVARRLEAGRVPVFAVRPADAAIASALRIAILLAGRRMLADAQLTVALVEVPSLRDAADPPTHRQAREELRLAVHGFLVREAQQMSSTVSQVSDHAFLVLATRGSLASAAAGAPPFVARAREVLGLRLDVGIGTGRSEREAEEQARLMLAQGHARPAAPGVAADPSAAASGLPGRADPADGTAGPSALPALIGGHLGGHAEAALRSAGDGLSKLRSLETLARLARKLTADATPVVDAELTGRLLSVTPRTARRQLRALADQGLALPLPPSRNRHPGRPRQAYRLVIEKLDQRTAQ